MTRGRATVRGGWIWRPVLGGLLSQLVLGVARPALSYGAIEQGADALLIGSLAAVYGLVPMLLAVPLGVAAGRLRAIWIVPLGSSLLFVVACCMAAISPTLPSLFIASGLIGVSGVGVAIGAQAWITRSAPPARYTSGFGWLSAGAALGQSIGPLITGTILGHDDLSSEAISGAFWVAAAFSVLLCGIFLSRASRQYSIDDAEIRPGMWGIIAAPGILRYIFVSAAVLTSVDVLTAYLPVLGESAGLSPFVVGLLLSVRGLASMASRLFLGPLARHFSLSTLIAWSTAGSAVSLLFVALFTNPIPLFAAMIVGGAFLGMAQPLTISAVAVALPPRARSEALAVRMLGNNIAQAAVPLVAGVLAAAVGVGVVFLAQAIGLAASSGWELAARSSAQEDE